MKTERKIRQFTLVLCIPLAMVLAGCISQQTAASSAEGKLLQDAERYARELKDQDKLPGYGSREHGRVIAMAPWTGGDVSYPATATVRAWKRRDETMYCYDLVKDSPQSTWQLTKATHLDKHSKLIDQLYPK
jgi:hypothetical protein